MKRRSTLSVSTRHRLPDVPPPKRWQTLAWASVLTAGMPLLAHAAPVSTAGSSKTIVVGSVSKSSTLKKVKKSSAVGLSSIAGAPVATIDSYVLRHNDLSENAQTILNRAPGTTVTSTNPLGVRPHISIHGFSQTQLGYTFDGLPIGDLFNGGLTGGNNNYASLYNLVPVTLGETSGIGVLYGPSTPESNAIGAMGGTIAYAPRMPGAGPSASAFAGYGSFDTQFYGASVNTGKGHYGDLYIRASSHSTGNYLQNANDRGHSFYSSYVLPSADGRSQFSAIFLLNNNSGYIPARMPEALVQQYGVDYQWPLDFTYSYGTSTHEMAILGYKSLVNRNILFDTKAFYSYTSSNQLTYQNPNVTSPYQGDITYDPAGAGSPYDQYDYVTRTGGATAAVHLLFGQDSVTFGDFSAISLYHSSQYFVAAPGGADVQGQNDAWDEHAYRLYNKLFIQASLHFLHGLTVVPGVKQEYVNTNINDVPGYYYPVGASSGNTYTKTSPYLGITEDFTHRFSVYGNVSEGYKFPNISAYYAADGYATATSPPPPITIVPEKVISYQLGTNYVTHKGSVGAALYRQFFQNTFSSVYDLTNGLTYEYNFGSSEYTGFALTGSYDVTRGLKVYGSYSVQSAHYTSNAVGTGGAVVAAGDPRQYTPRYLVNLGLDDTYDRFDTSLWLDVVGPQYIGNSAGGPTNVQMGSYTTFNASFTYTLPIHMAGVHSIKASLNLTNLFNSGANVYEKQFPYAIGAGNYNQVEPMMPRFIGVELKATM